MYLLIDGLDKLLVCENLNTIMSFFIELNLMYVDKDTKIIITSHKHNVNNNKINNL